jgi:hypothetical protein
VIDRLRRTLIVAAAAAALLSGCAQAPAYEPETAERLQGQVLAVSTSTAEGDWAGASTRLMELEASASTALARGEITQERYDAIMAALQLVRADVDTALAAAEAERLRLEEEAARQAEEAARQAEEAARQAEESRGNGDDKKKDEEKDDD